MKKYRRGAGSKKGIGSILFGVLLSFGFLIALSLVAAIFLANSKTPGKSIGIASLAVLLLASFIPGFINSKRCAEGGFLRSVITSAAFTLLLLSLSLVAAGGKIGGGPLMNCLCYMLVSILSAFLGGKKQKRHKRHKMTKHLGTA